MSSAALRDTIAAVSSGAGKAGVAVVRASGPGSRFAIETLAGDLPEPRMAALRRVRSPRSDVGTIDSGLVLWFPGPESFTGEDVAEFQVHGGRGVVAALLDALIVDCGARLAEPGEFTRRAFENGKLDLLEVEALADLIDSETVQQRRQALRLLEGRFSEDASLWREALLRARALAEAALDFADESDVTDEALAQAVRIAGETAEKLQTALLGGRHRRRIRDGFRIVLGGPPNAGKSSLINAIVGRSVAITSPIPGTTRDVIEAPIDLGGMPVVLCDTAGLHDRAEGVEAIGIARSREQIAAADLVLWLSPADSPQEPPALGEGLDIVVLQSKADLGGPAAEWSCSARDAGSVDRLIEKLRAQLAGGPQIEAGHVTRARHEREIHLALSALREIPGLAASQRDEIVAENLRRAGDAIGRLSGAVDVEDVLGEIFASFCIGK